MHKACAACGKEFVAKRATAKFCSDTCRVRGHRGQTVQIPGQESPSAAGVVEATQTALNEAGRADSPLGQAALVIARKLDDGSDTGQGVATLAKQLQITLAAAVDGANTAADPVDELREWRDRKRRSATG